MRGKILNRGSNDISMRKMPLNRINYIAKKKKKKNIERLKFGGNKNDVDMVIIAGVKRSPSNFIQETIDPAGVVQCKCNLKLMMKMIIPVMELPKTLMN